MRYNGHNDFFIPVYIVKCIARVVEKLINDKVSEKKLIEDIKKQFECLVEAHLLQRMDTSTTNAELGITIHCQSAPIEQQFLLPPQLGGKQHISCVAVCIYHTGILLGT